MSDNGRLVSATEAADELGVVERTVRRWIESGDLPAEKRGGVFAIDLDAAREVMRRSRSGRGIARATEMAELRGRYLEVKERLDVAERELAAERVRASRLESILYPPARGAA